jgi:hypothetical protein
MVYEKYMYKDINLNFLLRNKIINKEIYDYINQNKIVIII